MVRRLSQALVVACLVCHAGAAELVAQDLGDAERARLDDWYRRTADRTAGGQWGIAIGTMDGRVLWSVSPELELIPASTTKVFTTGFSRTTMGGEGRITTRVIGDGVSRAGDGPLAGDVGAGAGRRPDPGAHRPRAVPPCASWPSSSGRVGSPRCRVRSPSPAGPVGPPRTIPRPGRPTSKDSSTPRRSARSRCTRIPSRSPSGRAGTSARPRSW